MLHVLYNSGELLATGPWNSNKLIQDIKDEYFHSSEENEMGLREIAKYQISLE